MSHSRKLVKTFGIVNVGSHPITPEVTKHIQNTVSEQVTGEDPMLNKEHVTSTSGDGLSSTTNTLASSRRDDIGTTSTLPDVSGEGLSTSTNNYRFSSSGRLLTGSHVARGVVRDVSNGGVSHHVPSRTIAGSTFTGFKMVDNGISSSESGSTTNVTDGDTETDEDADTMNVARHLHFADQGIIHSVDQLDVRADGELHLHTPSKLVIDASSLSLNKSTVTQVDKLVNNVNVNGIAGVIVTVPAYTGPSKTDQFCVNNDTVKSSSVVLTTMMYSGSYGSDGFPSISINNVKDGSFMINVTNYHAENALSGVLKIHFLIV